MLFCPCYPVIVLNYSHILVKHSKHGDNKIRYHTHVTNVFKMVIPKKKGKHDLVNRQLFKAFV